VKRGNCGMVVEVEVEVVDVDVGSGGEFGMEF
jgi:hypothetical protein